MEILWSTFNTGLLITFIGWLFGVLVVKINGWDSESEVSDSFVRWFAYPYFACVALTTIIGLILAIIKIWS